MRRPRTRRAAAPVALALLLLITLAPRGGGSVVAQEATPGATIPVSPDAAECTVEPRPLADFERLLLTTSPAAPASPTPFVVPAGEPADAAAVSGVTATLIELYACYQAGDPRRFHALFTDNGLQRSYPPGMVTQEFFDDFFAASPVPVEGAEDRATLLAIEDVVLLDDGRVGALVRSDEPEFGGLQASYYVFVQAGNHYLVDDVIHGLPTDGGTSEMSTPAP